MQPSQLASLGRGEEKGAWLPWLASWAEHLCCLGLEWHLGAQGTAIESLCGVRFGMK